MKKRLGGRLISPAHADILIQQGLIAADSHLHSSVSHDVSDRPKTHPKQVIETGFARGITYPIITDHDNMRAHLTVEAPGPFAAELSVTPQDLGLARPYEIHINAYMENRHDLAAALEMAAHGAYKDLLLFEWAKLYDRVLSWNHPFRPERKERLNPALMKQFARDFRAVEVVNAKLFSGQNRYAQRMADAYGLAAFAGTDNHAGSPKPMMLARGDSFWEWMDNVLNHQSYIVERNASSVTWAQDGLDWLELMLQGTASELELKSGDPSLDEKIALFIQRPELAQAFRRFMNMGIGPLKPGVLYARRAWVGPELERFKEFAQLPEVQELISNEYARGTPRTGRYAHT